MVAVGCLHGFGFHHEITFQTWASPFEDGIVSHWQRPLDSHSDARLKMRAEGDVVAHLQRDGAMGEHGALVGEVGGVGHEGFCAAEAFHQQHAHQGLHVAFATGHDAFVVEQGQSQTAGGTAGFHDVEAADGHGVEAFLLADLFDGEISLGRFQHVGRRRLNGAFGAFHDVLGHLHRLVFEHGLDAVDHPLQVDVEGLYPEVFQQVVAVHAAGDEPVGGLAEQADTGSVQRYGFNEIVRSMDNPSFDPLTLQPGENLQCRRQ